MKTTKTKALALMAVAAISISVLDAFAGAASFDVDGNGIVNAADIAQLQSALVRREAIVAADDVNADKKINAFDLCGLRRSVLSAAEAIGESVTGNYAATAENVKLVGRTLRKDDITWLVQSGSATEFVVKGTAAKLSIVGDGAVHSDEKYRPRYAVFVDDELVIDEQMSTESKEIQLFSGKENRTATVRVIHLSEANNGAVGVKNIAVTSGVKTPVAPVAKKKLSIEFIGDSITCAYGVEGESQYESFSTATENFMKSYAYLTASQLDADYSAVSYSGYGVISGYTTGEKNTDSLLPDCYGLVGKPADYAQAWDFKANPNDVVVINLGTNDNSYLSTDFEGRSPDFVTGYADFLKVVREKNPDAYIICTMGTMGGAEVYDYIAQAVANYQTESGDKKVTSYLSTVQNMDDGLGSDWHPSLTTQQNSAYVLADKICGVLGMESDKIGLDAAADATYDISINTASGANAAQYVGYDKSFWINMSDGGDAATDIQAFLTGIPLYPGEYQLDFDYTSTVDVTVPYTLQSTADATVLYDSGSISATGTVQHQTDTFTVSAKNENCTLLFLLGGQDYYNITLSKIKLVKLS